MNDFHHNGSDYSALRNGREQRRGVAAQRSANSAIGPHCPVRSGPRAVALSTGLV